MHKWPLVTTGFLLHPDGTRAAVALVDAEATQAALYARDKIVFWSGFFDYLGKNVVVKK